MSGCGKGMVARYEARPSEAFDVDLFLTTNESDAQKVIDSAVCASAVLNIPPEYKCTTDDQQVRIAFDGDAVLFDESSELVYKEEGIEAFHKNENEAQNTPMNEGPFAAFLIKLAKLQERLLKRNKIPDFPCFSLRYKGCKCSSNA